MPRANNRRNLIAAIATSIYSAISGLFYTWRTIFSHAFMLHAMGTFLTMLARSIVPAYIVPTVGFQIAIPVLAQVIFAKLGSLVEDMRYKMAEDDPNRSIRLVTKDLIYPRPVRSRFHELSDAPSMIFMLASANIASPGILANDAKRYVIAAAGAFLGNMFKSGVRALSNSSEVDSVSQLDNDNNATRPRMAV